MSEQHLFSRVVVSGNVVELYLYSSGIPVGQARKHEVVRKDYEEIGDEAEKRMDSLLRSRQTIRRLIWANQGKYTKFVTLTYRETVLDLNRVRLDIRAFVKAMRRRGYDMKYLYVLENQRERGEKEGNAGCLHVHMLIFIDQYIPQSDLTTCWKHGFIKINALDNVRSVAAYVCKYITKDNFAAFGQKVYGCSLGLNRGTEERFYTEGMSDNTYLHPKDVLKALDVTYYDKMHHGYIAQDGSAQQMTVSYYQGRWKGANVIEVAKANDRSDETENL